ncbi:DUF6233 domain-containing protein [Streptomyces sp. NBC_01353]|uniref:DUF6233 domain-containing protein n=1 Tax=Streptomyces sp. NBC_01353 TaxID=2903835 RepID=UPI002E320033|nr:DUF6233 domain-containing protein [Streptomyces sp. NBC_01353]
MNGLSIAERLEKQRTLRDWLRWQLDQADRTIRQLEAEEKEQERRREVARAEMAWKVLPSRAAQGQPMLHRGGCHIDPRRTGLLSQEEAFVAIQQFPELEFCDICAPWGSLGIDKPAPPGSRVRGDDTP